MNFIITGCAGAGKTTLINYLAELGYTCYEEVSRTVIREQLIQKTIAVPWKDTEQFCHLTFQEMMKKIPSSSNEFCFLDRGLPDLIAYLKAAKCSVPSAYYEALKNIDYAPLAFLFPPDPAIYVNDEERQESFEEAVIFFQAIQEIYQLLGFTLCVIPTMPLHLRAARVLEVVDNVLLCSEIANR